MLKVAVISLAFGLVIGLLVFRNKAIGIRIIAGAGLSIILSGAFFIALIIGGDQ